MRNVLIADCHDSFVYNLVQLLRESEKCTYDIVRIDDIDVSSLHQYSHILLSPGPGLPEEFPNLLKLIDRAHTSHSILGVCLGLQAIGHYFGGKLRQLSHPLHGHTGHLVPLVTDDALFKNIPPQSAVGHYHSWLLDAATLPHCLEITATDKENRIMAIRHRTFPLYGVQFHPESIITRHGKTIIENWLAI